MTEQQQEHTVLLRYDHFVLSDGCVAHVHIVGKPSAEAATNWAALALLIKNALSGAKPKRRRSARRSAREETT